MRKYLIFILAILFTILNNINAQETNFTNIQIFQPIIMYPQQPFIISPYQPMIPPPISVTTNPQPILSDDPIPDPTPSILNWNIQTYGARLTDVFFINELKGWAVGLRGIILYTSDGGSTWVTQNSKTHGYSEGYLWRVFFINELEGWVIDYNGKVLHTVDGGINWNVQASFRGIASLSSIYFADNKKGWIGGHGGCGTCSKSIIYYTSDGGVTWTKQADFLNGWIEDFSFISPNIGWAADWNYISHTSNGGLTWEAQLHTGTIMHGIHFVDLNNGWAVGNWGKIFYTTNSGLTWNEQNSGTQANLGDVHFTDLLHGYITGHWNNTLLTTEDG